MNKVKKVFFGYDFVGSPAWENAIIMSKNKESIRKRKIKKIFNE